VGAVKFKTPQESQKVVGYRVGGRGRKPACSAAERGSGQAPWRGRAQRGGQGVGAGSHLVAAVLVQHHQEDGHGHDYTDHGKCVQHGVEEALAH
jgi:hypothetical protein